MDVGSTGRGRGLTTDVASAGCGLAGEMRPGVAKTSGWVETRPGVATTSDWVETRSGGSMVAAGNGADGGAAADVGGYWTGSAEPPAGEASSSGGGVAGPGEASS